MALLFPPMRVRWAGREVSWAWVPTSVGELINALRPTLGEMVGTLAFVFLAGSLLIHAGDVGKGSAGLLTLALGTAVAYGVLVAALHPVSGGHLNPAVTIGVMAAGRIPPLEALLYIGGQLAGGILGALALDFAYRDVVPEAARRATLAFGDAYTGSWSALFTGGFLEAALTFVLVLVFLGTLVDPRGQRAMGGLAVGLVVLAAMAFAFPLTGAGLNVARVMGPAAVASHWTHFAMYWLGLLGGALAGLTYAVILSGREES
jgi:glycerol uptake facilitator-like aquaporin